MYIQNYKLDNMSLISLLKEDFHHAKKFRGKRVILLPEYHITIFFRLASYFQNKFRLLYYPFNLCLLFLSYFTGIQIKPGCKIGGGLRFAHFSCIVIAGSTTIGKNCSIMQGVTCGCTHHGAKKGAPIIGDDCILCAGAKLIGHIHVGNNVVIGANSVVVDDVPDNCIVAGIPAKIIKTNVIIKNEIESY